MSNGASSTYITGYDPLGEVTDSQQVTAGQTYRFHYEYNLLGSMTGETYPSGRVVTTGYDQGNRPSYLQGSLAGVNTNYIGNPGSPNPADHYWPHGQLRYYTRGNGLTYAVSFNARLQQIESYEAINNDPGRMQFVSCPNWGTTTNTLPWLYDLCPHTTLGADNDNLLGYTEYHGGSGYPQFLSFNQAFSYDAFSRLTGVSDSGGYVRNFAYDRWGNMSVSNSTNVPLYGTTPLTSNNPFNASTNRLVSGAYDAAGNQLGVRSVALGYDAENRQIRTQDGNYQAVTYGYDGNGQRVSKTVNGGATTIYAYDIAGRLIAEYSTAVQPAPPCTTCYYSYDHLGSVRMITDQAGNVVSRHDYLPFGEELFAGSAGRNSQFGANDNVTQRFTGKEADPESGLLNFGARYMSGALGRFTSPDEVFGDQDESDPQSWNLYGYARNNPLRNVDLDGRACSSAKGPNGETITTDLDGNGCAALHDNTVHGDEPGLLMLASVGESLTNPHNAAQLVSDAGRSVASFIAPVASSIAECITPGGNCDSTNLALAAIPHAPRVPGTNVGRYVKSQKLRNILAAFNRTGTGVGTGSTADAIREELQSGMSVGGKFHSQKGVELRDGLLKVWRTPGLDSSDRAIVKELLTDLQDALSRKR